MRPSRTFGLDPSAARRAGADLQTRLGPYPRERRAILQGLSGAGVRVDQLGMSLKLGLHQRGVLAGVARALVDHRHASADRAVESLGK